MFSFLKKIPVVRSWILANNELHRLKSRVDYLEKRVHNHRWFAVEEMWGYLVGAQLEGDYCEFGVFQGETFAHCLKFHQALPDMRYFAFDSFEGLPVPRGIDNENGFTSNFYPGEFSCSEEQFLENLQKKKLLLDKVITVKGWFDQTLTPETADKHRLKKIAAAWIDGDLYESCVPVLKFLTMKISIGTIILFDDWHVYRNLPTKGEQRACREWLEENPNIQLAPIFSFGHYGEAFTVVQC